MGAETVTLSEKPNFRNLTGLRFIAASMVVIHHIDQLCGNYGFPHLSGSFAFLELLGNAGVVLFFSLSGFLITYLLLFEEKTRGNISISKFYLRRIFRIWPLYFLLIFTGIFYLPELTFIHDPNFDYAALKANLLPVLLLYIFILPNLVGPVFGGIPFISHTWSIGTEEQFYAIWPWIIRGKSSSKKIRILAVIAGYLGIALFLSRAESGSVFLSYWKLFKIDCMAIGAFFAVLLFERSRILGLLYHPAIFYPVFFTVVVILLTGTHLPFIHSEIQAILYSVLILNLAANDAIRLNLDRGIMKNLGEISYGIYMYHPLCIGFTFAILRNTGMLCSPLLYLLTFATTLLISWTSFQYFEKYFIRLKDRKFSF